MRPFSDLLYPSSEDTQQTPLNNVTPDQAFLAETYDKNARCAGHGISALPSKRLRPLAPCLVSPICSSSFSFQTVEHALVEIKGSGKGATFGSPVLRGMQAR